MMRERISKAKAYIAVRNYNAAIYELESIRRESSDTAVHGVVNVLLMNSYLEQGDYKRAQDFLNQAFTQQKTTKPDAGELYMTVASQVVKGARSRAERYRALGLNVADRMLPLEALNDLEKMRETLEIVIAQSKEIGKAPAKTSEAMGLLEEAINSRTMLARDDYDARRWKDEVADTREAMANSRSVVLSAVQGEPATAEVPKGDLIASNNPPVVMQPVVETRAAKPLEQRDAKPAPNNPSGAATPETNNKPIVVQSAPPTQPSPAPVATGETAAKPEPSSSDASKTSGPLDVGPLKDFATAKPSPVYPQAARVIRQSGIVRVDVTVNEAGEVTEVQKTTGPAMLQAAARDAIKKWKFKPFTRDGQPVKATGYVSFNFNL